MKLQGWIFILGNLGYSASAIADATHIAMEATVLHESNIGRAEYGQDEQEDTALQLGASISRSMRFTENSGLVARAGIQLSEQAQYNDLSLVSAQGGVRYRIQPFSGFTMPWLDIALNAERLEYRDSDIRDGWIGNLSIGAGKYFTDRLRMTAGWIGERRHAEDSRVFDLRNHGWQLGLDFKLTPRATLYAKAGRMYGDQVSTAPQSSLSPSPLQYQAQTADEALTEHGQSRTAYRFDAVTNSIEIGYNHALMGSLAVDISARYFDADAKGGHTYEGYSARAGLLYQF
jgi:hypothetical protein